MGFDDGEIVMDSANCTYFAGQTLFAKLVFRQDKVKSFKAIYVKFKGFCNVHWKTHHTRRVNDREERYTVDHNSYEEYFDQKVYLVGGGDGQQQLNPGNHEFPFQFVIPQNSPSSFEGSNGHIRYELKAVVDRPWKFDQEMKRGVNIVAQRDLNAEPYCKEPVNFSFVESYCCCCVSSGVCTLDVNLRASGYVPGQTASIEVTCENKSNLEITQMKFELKEEITFRATSAPGQREDKKSIAVIKKGPVPENTTRNWTLEMEIPQMDLYNVDACKYIDIDYEFEVTISPSGCHSDTSASRRIVLGHIPLREFEDVPLLIPNQPIAPVQQFPTAIAPSLPNQNYPQYPGGNMPFPSPVPNVPYQPSPGPFPNSGSGPNMPYPSPVPNVPYPVSPNMPYPGPNQPYPPPYSDVRPVPGFGFAPPADEKKSPYPGGPTPAYPYASASAPEPGTPDFDTKTSPAFNPNFK